MNKLNLLLLGLFSSILWCATSTFAQPKVLTLDSCQAMARRNYPLIRQFGLIKNSESYSLENVNKNYLPQVALAGQATYQSDVTSFPMAAEGFRPPILDKDQYRATVEISQSITDILNLGDDKSVIKNQSEIAVDKIEVELHKISERINQLYFSILLLNTQEEQLNTLRNDVQIGLDKTQVAVSNGVALNKDIELLQAEMLKIDQRYIELSALRKSYASVLSGYIGIDINEGVTLEKPFVEDETGTINRPELSLYKNQQLAYDLQSDLLTNRSLPKLSWFAQGGYGKPGLNILNNRFDSFYIAGLKLSWNFSTLYTIRNDRKLLDHQKQSIDVTRETFLFNTEMTTRQQDVDIEKYGQLIDSDHKLIALRERIKNTTQSQLEYGTATTSDYLEQVNATDEVRQNLAYHEIQRLMTLSARNITTGN